jgi:hypothetical protein
MNQIDFNELRFDPVKHEYFLGEKKLPSVTQVIDYFSLIDTRFYPEWVRDRGQAVHAACEFDDEGTLDESTVDTRVIGRLRAYRRFKAEVEHAWEYSEKRLFHPIYRYAGTLDRAGLMVIKGDPWNTVLDFKSGAMLDAYRLQLAGYVALITQIHPEKNPMKWQRVILQLQDDGKYKPHVLPQEELAGDMAAFLGYVNAMNWEISHGQDRRERRAA